MKLRYPVLLTLVLTLGLGIYGRSKLATFTDLTQDPNFQEDFLVAQMPQSLIDNEMDRLEQSLPLAAHILKVTPIEEKEVLFRAWRQKVTIQHVYKSQDLEPGQDLYLYSDKWYIVFPDKLNLGFTNFMERDQSYLVFLREPLSIYNDPALHYAVDQGEFIVPVFSYQEHDNKILPLSGDGSTYVAYAQVAHNEFFANEQAGMDRFLQLKKTLLERYP